MRAKTWRTWRGERAALTAIEAETGDARKSQQRRRSEKEAASEEAARHRTRGAWVR